MNVKLSNFELTEAFCLTPYQGDFKLTLSCLSYPNCNIGLISLGVDATDFTSVNKTFAFSKREIQCIQLALAGNTAKETAKRLALSYRTVEHYLENIKTKLGATSKIDLIIKIKEQLILNPTLLNTSSITQTD